MSIETSQPIAALTGSVQQKTSQAAFNRQISETSSGTKAKAADSNPVGSRNGREG